MFTDPAAQVVIKNQVTGQVWDWDAPDFPFLTGAVITSEMGRIVSVQVSIDVPYEEGIAKILTPPTPFAIGNLLQCRIGYASGLWTPWAMGILQQGGVGLSVDANGVSGSVTFEGVATSAFYGAARDMPRYTNARDLLGYLAHYMGLELALSASAEEALTARDLASGNFARYCSMSHWEALKDLLVMSNMACAIGAPPWDPASTTRSLVVYVRGEADTLVPRLLRKRYVVRGAMDVANNLYPCLTWAPEGAEFATWLANTPDPAAHGVRVPYVDLDTGAVKELKVHQRELPTKAVGPLATNDPLEWSVDGVVGDRALPEQDDVAEMLGFAVAPAASGEAEARQVIQARAVEGNPAQQGTITTLGVPDEFAGNMCELHGAGPVYDGPYEVRGVTHTYSAGSFETALTVLRQGVGGGEKTSGPSEDPQKGQMS